MSRGNFNFFDIIIIDNVVIASVTPVVLCLHLQVPPLISQTWPAIEGRKYVGIGFKGVQSFFFSLTLQTPEKKFPESFLSSFCSVLSRRARPNASAQTSYIWRKKIKKRQDILSIGKSLGTVSLGDGEEDFPPLPLLSKACAAAD